MSILGTRTFPNEPTGSNWADRTHLIQLLLAILNIGNDLEEQAPQVPTQNVHSKPNLQLHRHYYTPRCLGQHETPAV
jgi:hypothetical protein